VTAITDNPNWSSTVTLISLLNATYLLPDSTGPGTILLPTNQAFRNLRKCPPRLAQPWSRRRMCCALLPYAALHCASEALTAVLPHSHC
jgi:hypothetical protein